MDTKFIQRLNALLIERGMKQADLAKLSGIRASSISDWLAGKYAPKQDKIDALAKALNVSPAWLIGYGEDKGAFPPISSAKAPARKGNRIPVLGRVAAGIPIEAVQDIEDYEEIPASWGDPREYFALKIQGHSMEPRIWDGDVVIARKMPDVDSGSVAVVLVDGEEATVKQIKKSEDGMTLIGWNPAVYPPKFYTWAEVSRLPVQILGLVREVRGKIT